MRSVFLRHQLISGQVRLPPSPGHDRISDCPTPQDRRIRSADNTIDVLHRRVRRGPRPSPRHAS